MTEATRASVREPFSPFTYFVLTPFALSCIVALHLKPTWRFVAFVLYTLWSLTGLKQTTDDLLLNYFIGLTIGMICMLAFVLLVLDDPIQNWRHEAEPGTLSEKPYWKRVWWLGSTVLSHRGIGWTYQVPFVPPRPGPDRWAFITRKLYQLALNFLLMDVLQTYKAVDPVFLSQKAISIWSLSYYYRSLLSLLSGCQTFATLCIQYNILAIIVVALGIQEPRDWPDMFGDWHDAYTIRKFWARTWHQQVRRYTGPFGKASARVLGLKPGSWLSGRVQLLVGFFASGLAHVPADHMVDPKWTGYSMPFFLIQPIAITVEDWIIKTGASMGIKESRWTRLVGYVWTWAVWFQFSVIVFTHWFAVAGMTENDLFEWSVVRPALGFVKNSTGIDIMSYIVPTLQHTA